MSHVLVVDDDLTTAESLAAMVSLLGHKVSIALSPRTALEDIQRYTPSLILLDLNMPGVDGLEVCRFIKRDPMAANTPVIFVSAEDDPTAIEAAKQAGASGYLVKPIELDALERVLQHTM